VRIAPEIRFARATGSTIAYMVYGEGPVTICAVPPMAANVELAWNSKVIRRMFERYASFSRQVAFDKRGTGMSDRSLDIPGIDERVDELSAVMDDAGIDHAYLHGLSEGGPMAIMFAATYPERVDGLILEGTGASLATDADRATRASPDYEPSEMRQRFISGWGTPDSITLEVFAPTLLEDEEFVAWWPTYERQAANRDAIATLFDLNIEMDARDALPHVTCPVLILHRTDDLAVPVERARETYDLLVEAGADVRMVELPGVDHFTFARDIDAIADEIERFTTGTVRDRPAIVPHRVEIRTLGEFEVLVDGDPVPTSAWGSKRARTVLKRLVAARGWPVTRDELIELLWPDELSDRLSARLSVQLSAVRRVLHGAVVADRSTVRLDLDAVVVDLAEWSKLDDDDAVVDTYVGDFLPEDVYEDWSAGVRDEARSRFVVSARRVAAAAQEAGDHGRAESVLRRIVAADSYDEPAHRALVATLHAAGRLGEARAAHDAYVEAMSELAVPADDYDVVISAGT
jgi:pimeloyl-ACP methyl ester carboxylesterase/DNA-binding SARP family transcriptional activator